MEVALEAGADDLQTEDAEMFEVYTGAGSFEAVRQALEAAKIPTVEAKIDMIPGNYVTLDEQKSKQVMRLSRCSTTRRTQNVCTTSTASRR